ncbi:hypothetical protein EBU94_02690 [bacterium]|nr:hypothetical protein [bacterium]
MTIKEQLDEISELKDGWYDGEGTKYNKSDLDTLLNLFETKFPGDWTLPYIFPDENGDLSFEWNDEKIAILIDWGISSGDCCFFFMEKNSDLVINREILGLDQTTQFDNMLEFLSSYL